MDTKQLLTFKIAAETLNFTRTARQLHFAQPSVTAQIQALERELGQPLFERLGKKIKLTKSGIDFKKYADQMVQLTRDAEARIMDAPPTLTIGVTESQCTYRLPQLLKKYKLHYPKARLIVTTVNFDSEVREGIMDGRIDLGWMMGSPHATPLMTGKDLIDEKMILVASSEKPISAHLDISDDDLNGETFLLTTKGCSYRNSLEDAFEKNEIVPETVMEFVTTEAIKQCAIAGIGIAFLPEVTVQAEIEKGLLTKLNWQSAPKSVPTYLAWHKDKQLTDNMRFFIEAAHAMYGKDHVSMHS
ncbi:LysR family transcriptional regulator [Sporolactobacillus shoreicorticis]|uniref:LysR family transcriptional regulator n=1 Tax=Sporolactobacillus shoreicorticis TaxID=1923877 RepID=A0ABW5S1E6_9BACL|nr:LysR family transcriptional regulator [Sporolactobacillus shoreicorticis]MCO7126521.1 LysR family transcriptional regulator [Sporolactobacillus shoreicorticis]